jgi:hypothetical protein
MRQVFRKFAFLMKTKASYEWKENLEWKLDPTEYKRLCNFINERECVYAYKVLESGAYEKRPQGTADSKKDSLLSLLCYKVNQSTVDQFMKRKELNFAFYCALPEAIKLLTAENAKPEAISAAQSLAAISVMYANQLRFN